MDKFWDSLVLLKVDLEIVESLLQVPRKLAEWHLFCSGELKGKKSPTQLSYNRKGGLLAAVHRTGRLGSLR